MKSVATHGVIVLVSRSTQVTSTGGSWVSKNRESTPEGEKCIAHVITVCDQADQEWPHKLLLSYTVRFNPDMEYVASQWQFVLQDILLWNI